jgi:hypothetical protein
MTLQHLKRLQRLEARRRPTAAPWFDPFPVAMRLWEDLQAVSAGKAEWIPIYGPPHWTEEQAAAFGLRMRESDRIAERLAAKPL